jgi:hypothetical protein
MSNQNREDKYDGLIYIAGVILTNTAYLMYSAATNSPIDIGFMVGYTAASAVCIPVALIGGLISIPIIGYSTVKLLSSLFR